MTLKRRITTLFQRFPWLARMMVRVYRKTQAHYTAGVIGVLLDDEGRVLLVEHVFHLGEAWGFPGGWIGRSEHPMAALEREFREETGLEVKATIPLLVQNGTFWGNHLDLAFRVEAHSPLEPIKLSHELLSYQWYKLDALPPMKDFHRQVLEVMAQRNLL